MHAKRFEKQRAQPIESVVIVTPALADANNGNWQTARRWARMLASAYRVQLLPRVPGPPAATMRGELRSTQET